MHYYAESSCTAGRTAFFTGMHPDRAGMVLPGGIVDIVVEPERYGTGQW